MGDQYSGAVPRKLVARMPPVVSEATAYAAVLSSTGSLPPVPPFFLLPCSRCLAEDETI